MNTEKVYQLKNSYLQINISQFGLGFSIDKKGIDIIILFLYIGYHLKN